MSPLCADGGKTVLTLLKKPVQPRLHNNRASTNAQRETVPPFSFSLLRSLEWINGAKKEKTRTLLSAATSWFFLSDYPIRAFGCFIEGGADCFRHLHRLDRPLVEEAVQNFLSN
jgi:hypothetical protein